MQELLAVLVAVVLVTLFLVAAQETRLRLRQAKETTVELELPRILLVAVVVAQVRLEQTLPPAGMAVLVAMVQPQQYLARP
jgi:hypothetical protein